MKKNNSSGIFTFSIIVALACMGMAGCTKKSNTSSTGTFAFHLHTNIDTNEVDDTSVLYRDAMGRHFSLSTAQFYITSVTVHNVTGADYTIQAPYILKDIDSEQYIIGAAPVGTYTSVTFTIGYNAAASITAPAGAAAAGMAYSDASEGYMAMKLQGKADTSAAQNGTGTVPFLYELGFPIGIKTVTLPARGTGTGAASALTPYILTAGGTTYIHVICDYGKLLPVVDFKTQDTTNSFSINPSLALTIGNNIANMFYYEE